MREQVDQRFVSALSRISVVIAQRHRNYDHQLDMPAVLALANAHQVHHKVSRLRGCCDICRQAIAQVELATSNLEEGRLVDLEGLRD